MAVGRRYDGFARLYKVVCTTQKSTKELNLLRKIARTRAVEGSGSAEITIDLSENLPVGLFMAGIACTGVGAVSTVVKRWTSHETTKVMCFMLKMRDFIRNDD